MPSETVSNGQPDPERSKIDEIWKRMMEFSARIEKLREQNPPEPEPKIPLTSEAEKRLGGVSPLLAKTVALEIAYQLQDDFPEEANKLAQELGLQVWQLEEEYLVPLANWSPEFLVNRLAEFNTPEQLDLSKLNHLGLHPAVVFRALIRAAEPHFSE